jgi:hypothetical protein
MIFNLKNKNIFSHITLENYKNLMNKILQIKKIFEEKILYGQENNLYNLYNFSTNLLLDKIKNNIQNIIDEYYFIGIEEFNLLKQKLIKNFLLLKNKNYYNSELSFDCDDIIDILNSTYFPVYMNYNIYNQIEKDTIEIKEIKEIKFYHKSNSFDIKNNFYDYSYINISPIKEKNKNENTNLSDFEDENIFINNQRQNIKNKMSLSNFTVTINSNIKNNIVNKPKKINKKTNKKKEYKILSKKNILIDWNKSNISI